MDIHDLCEIYCLNYKNEVKKENMIEKFNKLDMSYNLMPGVEAENSLILGHLDMIRNFYYNTAKLYGIFCEDDIYIHKNFKTYLPQIIKQFDALQLDILLLGYLTTIKLNEHDYEYKLKNESVKLNTQNTTYNYYSYPNDLWGTQMYMLSRKQAKVLLDTYTDEYKEKCKVDNTLPPFAADWTITKNGNRAALFPLLVVEDGKKHYDHWGQHQFHYYSFFNNYIEGDFV